MTQINFMNYEVFQLDLAQTELSVVKEAITCLLHTIAFHRAYGPTLPVTVECGKFSRLSKQKLRLPHSPGVDFLDVAYVRVTVRAYCTAVMTKATSTLWFSSFLRL